MTYADIDDVAKRLGRPITDDFERAQVESWLEDAEAAIRARIPDLDELVTAEKIPEATVVSVQARAVVRVALNPEGWRQFAIDDFSRTRDQVLSDGQVRILAEEWAQLMPWLTTALPTAYVLDLGTPL